MASALVGGAVLGAVFGELLKLVVEETQKAIYFKSVLNRIQTTLIQIQPIFNDIQKLNNLLNERREETDFFMNYLEDGKKLVLKCSTIHVLNAYKKAKYSNKLEDLDKELLRFFQVTMPAGLARDVKKVLVSVRDLQHDIGKVLTFIQSGGGSGCAEERERTGNDTNGNGSMLVSQDGRRITECAGMQSTRRLPQGQNAAKRVQHNYRISIPVRASTLQFSSPAQKSQRNSGNYYSYQYTPQVLHVWSAPETAPVDRTLDLGSPYQISPEKTAFSSESSPLHSPILSSHHTTKPPGGPASPIQNKSSAETSMMKRDSNAQPIVHPLPLPPGAAMPPQPAATQQVTAKPEVMPIKCQWQKGKLIGCGTFGSVYVASNLKSRVFCALKEVEILLNDPKSADCARQLEQEIKLLSQLKHPNIVQYYGSEMVEDRFHIYLEYVRRGSITKYIRDHCGGAITESVVKSFTRHILCGLAYLHSMKTMHRDIKGANLLVDANGVVKLADFGMAKHLTGLAANLSLTRSPYWMAPELLESVMHKDACSDLTLAVDIWSLGCTIIEILNGKPPWSEYEGAAALFKILKVTPSIPQTLSAEGKDFLHHCFRRDPAQRPTARMLLKHRFLRSS